MLASTKTQNLSYIYTRQILLGRECQYSFECLS